VVQNKRTVGWKGLSVGLGALAGLITQRLLELVWRHLRDASPPVPANRRSPWPDALGWAVATGVGMAVSRLLAIRTAAVCGRQQFTRCLPSLRLPQRLLPVEPAQARAY
jgi:Protein of unknown function (DUF4235)